MDGNELNALAATLKGRIDDYCIAKYSDEHRNHLGASVIGEECQRYIWLSFRWARKEVFSARMLRLFNRGKREEPLLIEYLRAAGVENFQTFDLSDVDQARFSEINGHYGGSTDGLGAFMGLPLVCEFKSHNQNSFNKLVKNRVIIAKPRHYAQMCAYGKAFGIEHGLYIGVCKNDDAMHIEIVRLDHAYADDLRARAYDIIFARVPPPKIALQSTAFQCSYCVFQGVCHRNDVPEKNCRSCAMAEPVAGGNWNCRAHNSVIPPEYLPLGCELWRPVTTEVS